MGELRDGELDEGIIVLCKRRASPVVVAAVSKYCIEGSGRHTDNPSAYVTFLLTKFARRRYLRGKGRRKTFLQTKEMKSPSNDDSVSKKFKASSKLAKSGVDVSICEGSSSGGISKIFPSAKRGEGEVACSKSNWHL